MIVETPAIVIRTHPFSETSVIARCFTREMGKIGLMVHGAKKSRSQRSAHFQSLSHLNLIFYHKSGRGLQTLKKSDFIETWKNYHNDLKRIALAMAAIELTEKTVTDEDPHPDLFDELVSVLRTLDTRKSALNLVFWYYELKLLILLGFRPDLDDESFHGVVFPDLNKGRESRQILEMLMNSELEDIAERKVDPVDRKIIHSYLLTHLRYHFEDLKELKTFNVLRSLVK